MAAAVTPATNSANSARQTTFTSDEGSGGRKRSVGRFDVCDAHIVAAVGCGALLWRVRVDLYASDGDPGRVGAVGSALRAMLDEREGDPPHGDAGADQGTGVAGRPVVGVLFWVRADDVGAAALIAVDTAQRAGVSHGVGPALYDVTVIPENAVARPGDQRYPNLPY
jgi:hypothetical protein